MSTTVRGLFGCDETYFLEEQDEAGHLVVWRGSRQSRDLGAEALLAEAGGHPLLAARAGGVRAQPQVRLSDIRTDNPASRATVRVAQQLLGPYQLALVLPAGPDDSLRAWLPTRSGRDFGDDEVVVATRVLPLLGVLDGLHRREAAVTAGATAGASVPASASVWSRLSPRERQVIDLLVAGLSAQRMGSVLGISPRTVGKHLQNAYDKLGQHDRLVIAVEHKKLSAAHAL